jgi:nucleoside-diphosphate-sugar epimerase
MKILVTGGSGFIGSCLVSELLAKGHKPLIFDKAPSQMHPDRVVRGDVRDREALANAIKGHDAVFNLAAEHRDDVRPLSLYEEVNVGGARNVVHGCEDSGCRKIVFTSSVAVYPLNAGYPSEDTPPEPFNEYGRSKLRAEEVFREFAVRDEEVNLTIVRPCVVFGERNRGNVYNLLRQINSGRFVMVGKGDNKKSMAYVGNVVSFLMKCLELGPGLRLYNYADKPDMCTEEIVRTARGCFGQSGFVSRVRVPYEMGILLGYAGDIVARIVRRPLPVSSIRVRKFCADTSVSTERLEATGFERPYSLEEALIRTIKSEF